MMKKLLLALLLSYFSVAATEPPTLYLLQTYSEKDLDAGPAYGVYTLKAEKDATPELKYRNSDYIANGGAVFAEGKEYILSYFDIWGTLLATYVVVDVETGEWDTDYPEGMYIDYTQVSSALTYDPTTGNAYCCTLNSDADGFNLSTMDLSTSKKTVVNAMPRMFVLAATRDGILYGIGENGTLYKIDKTTAELSKIGDTGIIPEKDQSATIDYNTGDMYWASYTADGGALYKVDIQTANAELITQFPDKEQYVGLGIIQSAQIDGAPAEPENFQLDFKDASLSGTASFDIPSNDVNGNPISTAIRYVIICDNAETASGEAAAGSHVDAQISVEAEGVHQFILRLSNESGDSQPVQQSQYVGLDTPCKISGIETGWADNKVTVKWTMQPTGVNGGFIDIENLKYKITRQPGDVQVSDKWQGAEFSEEMLASGIELYCYDITPYVGDKTGETSRSGYVTVGDHFTAPFSLDMTNPLRTMIFTAIDVNDDFSTWQYQDYMEPYTLRCDFALGEKYDDWLISPPILFEPDKEYEAVISIRSEEEGQYAGTFSLLLGKGRNAEAMTETLIEPVEVTWGEYAECVSTPFTVGDTEMHNLGLYMSGPRSKYYCYVDRIEIRESAKEGATDVLCNAAGISVQAGHGYIRIVNPTARRVDIYSAGGRLLLSSDSDNISCNTGCGVFIIRDADGRALKVAVR